MKLLRSTGSVVQRLLLRPGSALALLFLVGITLAAIFADFLPLNPYAQKLVNALNGPSAANWFGTDEVGRDILARVVFGARTSLLTAAGAVAIAAVIGVPIGLVAGFFGGWRDATLMRFVDVLLALPAILFAMAMIAVLGRSQVAALIAVGITGIPSFARITRAQVLSLRRRDFVTAVEAFGGSSAYNMFRTILPNSWSPIFVQVVVLCSVAILLEAALSFLGVGVAPPTPSWGEMLRTGKSYLHEAPYYAVLPGIVLTLTILSFDTIGRALAGILENRSEVVTPAKVGGTP
ncbi:MAG TPA: ABC transporter permease [Devosia sp.]|jgi:peptide/nickel transport system permease protein/oligopeptide transport system permease protein|uniref:ABC transporter permease n=1 Tax=Devosia sp. TaxID=1871048 RepID=UPI002DDD28B9|nr:ABC transporter permease [Devosia sp.]HEV2515907.1 ABC transporter permease [Devosia sp.]